MKPILYIKSSSSEDVRLRKFLLYFSNKGINVFFWGWDRRNTNNKIKDVNTQYIHKKGCKSKKELIFNYFVWMFKLFFKLLFTKNLNQYNIIAINFDSCFPIYMASKFRRICYFYEIYDEFALSYNFPPIIKRLISSLDHKMMVRAKKIIHVDSNRCHKLESNSIIIENTPYDFLKGIERDYSKIERTFAIIGYFSATRGLDQIYKFAKDNLQLNFLLVGVFSNNEEYKLKFNQLPNIIKYDFMAQENLFELMLSCCGIFSLYNPSIEINKLAASNKVYDAMMLGIPVITNKEVINSKFIIENKIGFVVNYQYDKTWDILKENELLAKCKELGENGRKLYLEKYLFDNLVENRLMKELD
ncbi:MAG: hypothetical protein ACK5HZ_04740 [Macellibacteroides fermentans]|uniref:hypothetical protein n=1 Tax=Macellibacteroides fermentans TaxID=879969 RepID=UPI003AC474F1